MSQAGKDPRSVRPWRMIERRKSRTIRVGGLEVGGDAPITVQTMTNTPTADAAATIDQIRRCEEAGADMVRVSCPDEDSTAAFRTIARASRVPLIADIHFHYKRGIEAAEAGAACLRINPGNIGSMDRVKDVVQAARDHGCAIRIGVNAGSLERHLLEKYGEPCPEAMVESALDHARILEDLDFRDYKISVKASDAFLTVAAYQALSEATDAPLHLGVTEAGGLRTGTVKSAIGIGSLLWAGIGDTIRVSLSAPPVEEVKVGIQILQSLNLRPRKLEIVSCPPCGRAQVDVYTLAEEVTAGLDGLEVPLRVAVMGCVVNGPGEAREADLGVASGNGKGQIFVKGEVIKTVPESKIVETLIEEAMRIAEDMEPVEGGAAEVSVSG